MEPFYARAPETRMALTAAAIEERRTLMERWEALAPREAEPWANRAKLAAGLLADQGSVADFGCGTMLLGQYLRPDQRYVPIDVVARDSRTLVCDLNREPPPPTGATAATFLGVFEYLFDTPTILKRLRDQYRVLIVSYCITDAPGTFPNRREHAWVSDYSEAQMLAMFMAANWRVESEALIENLQKVWRLAAA